MTKKKYEKLYYHSQVIKISLQKTRALVESMGKDEELLNLFITTQDVVNTFIDYIVKYYKLNFYKEPWP